MQRRALLQRTGVVALACASLACSGGAPAGESAATEFRLESIDLSPGDTLRLNEPIRVRFSADVDFSTVSQNTIRISELSGIPATGTFGFATDERSVEDPRTVEFRPSCPTTDDFSDGGLRPGGVEYSVQIIGTTAGGVTVRSTSGRALEQGLAVSFRTPLSSDPADLFLDTVPGPPIVRFRGLSAGDAALSYIELGGDDTNRLWLDWDATTDVARLAPGARVPLNLYSVQASRVALRLHVDQPVSPLLGLAPFALEYLSPAGWQPVGIDVELLENCTSTGALLGITPRGVLPQASELRLIQSGFFADLNGDSVGSDRTIARFSSAPVDNEGVQDPTLEADELLDQFLVEGADSWEDSEAALPAPRATWGGGRLTAAFDFDGSGGPGGDFDWVLQPGSQTTLDTTAFAISGGPGGAPATIQTIVNGVVDVRNLWVMPGARLVIVGPTPCTIFATGTVTIDGEVSVRGGNSPGVVNINAANQTEPGAIGHAGGGRGGTGSFLSGQSTPRGGHGFGAFDVSGGGGRGGESGYDSMGTDRRRSAGGGGGRFGPDVMRPLLSGEGTDLDGDGRIRAQTLLGMDAEPGFAGAVEALGALSQSSRPAGGARSAIPFADDDSGNDFLGSMILGRGTPDERLVVGELTRLWAGAGGGAGGDSASTDVFPSNPFLPGMEEKGAGGGGGGGGLSIFALGDISVNWNGRTTTGGSISVDGGSGAGGENVGGGGGGQFDRIGGSGGGSAGHLVLSSAGRIIVGGEAFDSGPLYDDGPDGHRARVLSALGGGGGSGHANKGGVTQAGPPNWDCDAIPYSAFEGTQAAPLFGSPCFMALPDFADPEGPVVSAGGDGGPGLIQLHVAEPAQNLLFPSLQDANGLPAYGAGLDVTRAVAPPVVGFFGPDDVGELLPFFGPQSIAQSKWIPLGLARVNPDTGIDDRILFRFEGTDADGEVLRAGESVQALDPILGPSAWNVDVALSEGDVLFDLARLALDDEIYKRNPALLRLFTFECGGTVAERFTILSAQHQFDAALGIDRLRLVLDATPAALALVAATPGATAAIVPRFFALATSGVNDALASTTSIRIRFDATTMGVDGGPSEAERFSHPTGPGLGAWATAIEDLNDPAGANWEYVRFRVEFDLGAVDAASQPALPSLRFLRLPFEF